MPASALNRATLVSARESPALPRMTLRVLPAPWPKLGLIPLWRSAPCRMPLVRLSGDRDGGRLW
jgi:hypothetical protein